MILGLLTATVPGFSKTPELHVTVRVLDYASLPADAQGELQAKAKRVLGQAGVAVEFVECLAGGVETDAEACRAPLGPTDLWLRIFHPKLAMKGGQLGYAAMTPEGGAYITVFINAAQEKARVGNLSNGALLGHAVAHEIGHLLLGANSHSTSGIMRPFWRTCDEEWMAKGVLLFHGSEAARMRAALTARLSR